MATFSNKPNTVQKLTAVDKGLERGFKNGKAARVNKNFLSKQII